MSDPEPSGSSYFREQSLTIPRTTLYGSFPDPLTQHHENGYPRHGPPSVNNKNPDRLRFPCQQWMSIYRRAWLLQDATAALSVASLYIPLSFSFAALAGVPLSSSLYSFVFQPLVYFVMGTCPQMVIGPEATGSLLVGSIVSHGDAQSGGYDSLRQAKMAGLATIIAGLLLCCSGLLKLGVLERALNRPLMKGFISGVGVVLIIDQSVTALDLRTLLEHQQSSRTSAATKLIFLWTHLLQANWIPAVFCGVTLSCIVLLRSAQKTYRANIPWLIYIPDRLILIILSIMLTRMLDLQEKGLKTIGKPQPGQSGFPPLSLTGVTLADVKDVLHASMLSALLGFFESSVTSQSLQPPTPLKEVIHVDASSELVALGSANLVGGCFSTLPAFGGFGRSQLNAQTGGLTPVSSAFLALIALVCNLFISSWVEFLPKATLAAMSIAVGIAMVEECWHDVCFFGTMRAYRELFLMLAVLCGIVWHSMALGIVIGLVMTAYQMVLNSTKSVARVRRRSIEDGHDTTPQLFATPIPGVLIIVPDSIITFSNYHHLLELARNCLKPAVEMMEETCPLFSEVEPHSKVIIDMRGVEQIDACSIQGLEDAFRSGHVEPARTAFCIQSQEVFEMFQRGGIVDHCGAECFFDSIEKAQEFSCL